jgi:hypothetical protein
MRVDPATAQVTVIGLFNVTNTFPPATMADLAFDPTTGILYGIGSGPAGPQPRESLGTQASTIVLNPP